MEHERPCADTQLTCAPVRDLDGPTWSSKETCNRTDEGHLREDERLNRIAGAMRTILECIGEEPDREGLLDTPRRYAKSILFMTNGYKLDADAIIKKALYHERRTEMVIVKDILFHSLCEHHILPFHGKIHVGYVPTDTIVGLSKIPRIVEMFSRRLQIQERPTGEVAHAIMDTQKPRGVFVITVASDLCMTMRGVEVAGVDTVTSCALGCFENESSKREEFFRLVGIKQT